MPAWPTQCPQLYPGCTFIPRVLSRSAVPCCPRRPKTVVLGVGVPPKSQPPDQTEPLHHTPCLDSVCTSGSSRWCKLRGVPSRGCGCLWGSPGRGVRCRSPWTASWLRSPVLRGCGLRGVAGRGTTHNSHLHPTLGVACDRHGCEVLLHLLCCGLVSLAQALNQDNIGHQQDLQQGPGRPPRK
jgi:hypothetical protein